MEPTLHQGSPLLVDFWAYAQYAPSRGDVVYFRFPGGDFGAVSRVVAIPGDRVTYDVRKQLTINGTVASRTASGEAPPLPWRKSDTYVEQLPGARHRILLNPDVKGWYPRDSELRKEPTCRIDEDHLECTVPPGRYFLMGDNRDDAKDSRYIGFIDEAEIAGRLSHGDAPLPVADDAPRPMQPPRP